MSQERRDGVCGLSGCGMDLFGSASGDLLEAPPAPLYGQAGAGLRQRTSMRDRLIACWLIIVTPSHIWGLKVRVRASSAQSPVSLAPSDCRSLGGWWHVSLSHQGEFCELVPRHLFHLSPSFFHGHKRTYILLFTNQMEGTQGEKHLESPPSVQDLLFFKGDVEPLQ